MKQLNRALLCTFVLLTQGACSLEASLHTITSLSPAPEVPTNPLDNLNIQKGLSLHHVYEGLETDPEFTFSGLPAGAKVQLYRSSSCSTAVGSTDQVTTSGSYQYYKVKDTSGTLTVGPHDYYYKLELGSHSTACLFLKKYSYRGQIKDIYSSGVSFAALYEDDSVLSWSGGTSRDLRIQDVASFYFTERGSNEGAFTVLKKDGTVFSWGNASIDLTFPAVQSALVGVEEIYANGGAFAALKSDGTVVTWGNEYAGGDSSSATASLQNVVRMVPGGSAFAAIKNDGTVVTWGGGDGGNSSTVQAQLVNIRDIYANGSAFAAVKTDGTVVTCV